VAQRKKGNRAERDCASDRPAFAAGYPASPELDALLATFRAGNHEAVRVGASKLALASADDAVRRAALELRGRLDPHPVSGYLLLLAVALLGVLAVHYLGG
jgi:hypothetical protein